MSERTLRIGFSGHQNIGDESATRFVIDTLRELLVTYRQAGQEVIAFSALAMGADQLFVNTALELGISVEAVIPCEEYATSFPTIGARDTYEKLLQRCFVVHRLPAHECSGDAYLVAGRWLVDHCNLMFLVWNGLPPKGRGGTGDVASYAYAVRRPFVHIHSVQHAVKMYGKLDLYGDEAVPLTPRREFTVAKQSVYQGATLTVNQYRLHMPDGKEIVRDIVERPESVLVLPVGQDNLVLLTEEYDLGAGVWQLALPGGKVEDSSPSGIQRQAEVELRQEIGYRAQYIEKLVDFYSHPGYVAHKVHMFVAHNLEWDPLELETHEEVRVQTYTLEEALAATRIDYRFDPEAALALWLYAGIQGIPVHY